MDLYTAYNEVFTAISEESGWIPKLLLDTNVYSIPSDQGTIPNVTKVRLEEAIKLDVIPLLSLTSDDAVNVSRQLQQWHGYPPNAIFCIEGHVGVSKYKDVCQYIREAFFAHDGINLCIARSQKLHSPQ